MEIGSWSWICPTYFLFDFLAQSKTNFHCIKKIQIQHGSNQDKVWGDNNNKDQLTYASNSVPFRPSDQEFVSLQTLKVP